MDAPTSIPINTHSLTPKRNVFSDKWSFREEDDIFPALKIEIPTKEEQGSKIKLKIKEIYPSSSQFCKMQVANK